MFSQIDFLEDGRDVLSFAADPEKFDELSTPAAVSSE